MRHRLRQFYAYHRRGSWRLENAMDSTLAHESPSLEKLLLWIWERFGDDKSGEVSILERGKIWKRMKLEHFPRLSSELLGTFPRRSVSHTSDRPLRNRKQLTLLLNLRGRTKTQAQPQ